MRGTVTLMSQAAHKQEEQDASGRNGGRKPLLGKREEAPSVGKMGSQETRGWKPPTTQPGAGGDVLLGGLPSQESAGHGGLQVLVSQDVGTNSSGSLGLTGPSDKKPT